MHSRDALKSISTAHYAGADYVIDFLDADYYREYGDLPTTATYPGPGDYSVDVLNAYPGPQGLRLGSNVDVGVPPNLTSTQDCHTATTTSISPGEVDDEDGVNQRPDIAKWTPSATVWTHRTDRSLAVQFANACYLNGWIDWNDNGVFPVTMLNECGGVDVTALRHSHRCHAQLPGSPVGNTLRSLPHLGGVMPLQHVQFADAVMSNRRESKTTSGISARWPSRSIRCKRSR